MARKKLIRLYYLKLFTGYGRSMLVKNCDLVIENAQGLVTVLHYTDLPMGKYLVCILTSPLQLFASQRRKQTHWPGVSFTCKKIINAHTCI